MHHSSLTKATSVRNTSLYLRSKQTAEAVDYRSKVAQPLYNQDYGLMDALTLFVAWHGMLTAHGTLWKNPCKDPSNIFLLDV